MPPSRPVTGPTATGAGPRPGAERPPARGRRPSPDRGERRVPGTGELQRLGRDAGLDAVGVAPADAFATTRRHLEGRKAAGLHGGMSFTYRRPERSTDPGAALPGAAALVVAARSYRRAASPPSATGDVPGPVAGRVARYAWEDHYGPLRDGLRAVAAALKAEGWRARVLADDNALVDREAAYRAGLGWYGKNANLLLPGEGSWFVLGSVVTDAPLAATAPDDRVADGCGTCTRCLTACPTGAIVAPGVVDARRCLAWLLQVEGPFPAEHRVALGDRIYGCDDCQEVCPPNRRAARLRPDPPPAGPDAEAVVDLLAMLATPDDELLARHGRWYVPRRQPRYLRRNALVALGNAARPGDPAVAPALARALASDDPLVRGHAVWAARRLGHDGLLAAVADDPDPLVRAELAAAVDARRPAGVLDDAPARRRAPGRLDGGGPARDDGGAAGANVDPGER